MAVTLRNGGIYAEKRREMRRVLLHAYFSVPASEAHFSVLAEMH